jgi:hypothetical protein
MFAHPVPALKRQFAPGSEPDAQRGIIGRRGSDSGEQRGNGQEPEGAREFPHAPFNRRPI